MDSNYCYIFERITILKYNSDEMMRSIVIFPLLCSLLCLIHLSILPQVVLPVVYTSPPLHREPSSPELWSVTMVFVSFLSNAIITLNSYSVNRTSADPAKCLCSPVRVLVSARVPCEPVRHLLAAIRWETLHHTEVRGGNRRSEC